MRWFYKLVENGCNSLMDTYSRGSLRDKLVVCHNTGTFMKYSVFDNYIKFSIYYFGLTNEERSFNEIILGENPQKPHFDIDVSDSTVDCDLLITQVVFGIKRAFYELWRLEIDNEIKVYTSHGKEKRSFHVVVDNYCHSNNRCAKEFYNKVLQYIDDNFKRFIDSAVYNSTQQFRMLFSHKPGSDRTKLTTEPFKDDLERMEVFRHSLVSETSECLILPDLENTVQRVYENQEFDLDRVVNVLYDFSTEFDVYRSKGSVISLTPKSRPWWCEICGRSHEHENPYLTVYNDSVNFHCRRNDKKLSIGRLEKIKVAESKKEEEEFKTLPKESILDKMRMLTGIGRK
jgi:hypothetical protein